METTNDGHPAPARRAGRDPTSNFPRIDTDMRVLGYARVPPGNDAAAAQVDLVEQCKRLGAYCLARQWTLIETYTDIAPGDNLLRPGLQRLIEDTVKHKPVDVLLVCDISRLTTDVYDLQHLLVIALPADGVCLTTVDGTIDTTTPQGSIVEQALAALSQFGAPGDGETA